MGLLITLFLIIVNTYGNVLESSPPNRGFGLIELWMMGAQFPVFFAMLQYGYILYQIKKNHGPNCPVRAKQTSRLIKNSIKIATKRPARISQNNVDPEIEDENEMDVSSGDSCCPNKRFRRVDQNSVIFSISSFAFFNIFYWAYVSRIVRKHTHSGPIMH